MSEGYRESSWVKSLVAAVRSAVCITTCGQQLCENVCDPVAYRGVRHSLAHVRKTLDSHVTNLWREGELVPLELAWVPAAMCTNRSERCGSPYIFSPTPLPSSHLPLSYTTLTCASSSSMRSNMASIALSASVGKCWKKRVMKPAASFFSPSEPFAALMIPS